MSSIATASGFPDVLDPRFMEVVVRAAEEEPDRIPEFYNVKSSTLEVERWSEIAKFGDAEEFVGALEYKAPTQGYSGTATQKQFAVGTQVERKLWELAQYDVIDKIFSMVGDAMQRRRQKDAARVFNQAFTYDSTFGTNEEGLPLCSNSHTTYVTGVSTSTGFDNLITDSLGPVSLAAALTQFRKFRDPAGEPHEKLPTHLIYPVDLEWRVQEILKTPLGLDTQYRNINAMYEKLTPVSWFRLTDSNNWFLVNEPEMKKNLFWFNVVEPEYKRVEDFDHIVAKYRGYMMYTIGRADWRWILGAQVS